MPIFSSVDSPHRHPDAGPRVMVWYATLCYAMLRSAPRRVAEDFTPDKLSEKKVVRVYERAASLKRCKCRTGYEGRGDGERRGGEEGARGPEMAALNPARSKTGFARHTKAPPRDEGSEKKRDEEEKSRKERENIQFHHRPLYHSSVNNG